MMRGMKPSPEALRKPRKTAAKSAEPKASPLYVQVKALMLRRLVDGVWRAGAPLPSEFQLAAEFGVSQGTVRKALDELAAENTLVRRQGRGTYVAEHDEARALFHFFHLVGPDGQRRLPDSRVISARAAAAGAEEASRLAIARGDRVLRIHRVRLLDGRPSIHETVVVPLASFPGLEDIRPLPNTLYDLYQRRWGVTIARAAERLGAVAANAADAEQLGIATGAPLLEIDRIALSLEGKPVEWRVSRCLTTTHLYQVELG